MMKVLYKIKYMFLGLLLITSGCSKFLDVQAPDNLVKDQFWQNREQVYSSLMGLYTSLNSCVRNFQVWGDSRSSLYAPGLAANFTSSYSQFLSQDIYTDNTLLSWESQYKAIGWINAFIKNAPSALKNDPTFKEDELKNMMGEAHALRALLYFYLLRSFKEVPIVKEPYESDSQNLTTAPSSEETTLNFIEEDLTLALQNTPETFTDAKEKYGRVTKNAVRAIMADVKLWRNDYNGCINLCKTLDATYANKLVSPQDWYTIFYPGNSPESIFELQYGLQGPSSPLYSWFAKEDSPTAIYSANATNVKINAGDLLYPSANPTLNFSADTIRLKNYSAFSLPSAGSTAEVYKFLGQAPYQRAYRRSNDRTANYIFYRYREIMFMKAEAYGMLGQYDEAEKVINIIRQHCDLPVLASGEMGTGADFFNRLLMEREFELGFEGKEWFAAVRVSRRTGLNNVLVEKAAVNNSRQLPYQVIRARLLDPESWFLPYYRIEVNNNPLLTQKSYYKNK
ncbi:RagB/SusD family nutrient uptake outer membrane protein [Pedobacter frigiditerrae]|uniref:RagB/SusD family nutrient uptake outer membrane protein n=1 Tax=Pedobacter frigiditerrae TaxID=2530452 RepID=UPI002930CE33|nr:RagB/SusD family nutrient uptake outer membrane protein [Pedobacter frigiditerrae]